MLNTLSKRYLNLSIYYSKDYNNRMLNQNLRNTLVTIILLVFSGIAISSDDEHGEPEAVDIAAEIQRFFPEATVIGEKQKDVPIIPVYQLQELLGYAFASNDFVNIPGFSGNRVNILIGMDVEGKLVGYKVIEHQEPIFLHGLGDPPLQEFIKQFIGVKVNNRVRIDEKSKAAGKETPNTVYIDGIARATVSAIVINDTMLSSSLKVARQVLDEFAQAPAAEAKLDYFEELNWEQLVNNGYVKKWTLTKEDVEEKLGGALEDYPDDSLYLDSDTITIYYGYLNSPSIGKNLLGDDTFHRLFNSLALAPNEHALFVASEGFYSYLEDEFIPGSIPERLSVNQGGLPIPLRDVNFFESIQEASLISAPSFENLKIFKIKPQTGFNPSGEIQLQLNMGLRKNHLVKQDITLNDNYQLPKKLFNFTEIKVEKKIPLWLTIWLDRIVDITILVASLALLTCVFIKQEAVSKLGDNFYRFRWAYLVFTLLFIGYYAQGQLSVVNIFTLLIALFTEFDLTVFLLDPIIFILWSFVFISLFVWGRGLFCGWLCPFGVLQEMVAWVASKLSIKQLKISQPLHHKLQKIKYVILLILVGMSFYSLEMAENMSEVEPFKTAITLNFVRYWPFVLYSILLLGVGLFINKFYCRYVCPLGAGLAVLGKFHIFEWLTRRKECGQPCQTCHHACGINAIEKQGDIDYDECIHCLECIVIINDDTRCTPEVVKAKKKKRTEAQAVRIIEPSAA